MHEHHALSEIIKHSLIITTFVFIMMILVDYINVLSKGKMGNIIRGTRLRQYTITSFLGATPGCLGAFANISFYVHGLISLGAIVGGMVATCGDEAFVMLAMFPRKALLIFFILFLLGITTACISDIVARIFKIKPCEECQLYEIHPEEAENFFSAKDILRNFRNLSFARFLLLFLLVGVLIAIFAGFIDMETVWMKITFIVLLLIGLYIVVTVPEHYLEEHIWQHIARKHLFRIFLWSLGALLFVDLAFKHWDMEMFIRSKPVVILIIACLVGLIPESGPHLVFVVMFARGYIPFSIILASCVVQDGHGILPLLSYSIRDSVIIKLFKLVYGLLVGLGLMAMGI